MKIATAGGIMSVTGITELSAANARDFRDKVKAEFSARTPVELCIDLEQCTFLDSPGLGALFEIYRMCEMLKNPPRLVLLKPKPEINQLLKLTQMHQLFEIRRG